MAVQSRAPGCATAGRTVSAGAASLSSDTLEDQQERQSYCLVVVVGAKHSNYWKRTKI